MSRLDATIADLTQRNVNRRRFMQRAAALGISVPALSAATSVRLLAAQPAENRVRWVSPRGTLEVLDDYPYWVARRFGYFGDIETEIEPGPMDATATVKLVDAGQSDMGYPSPGVFSLGLEEGIPIVSVWQMGAYDVFAFAVPKDSGITDLTELEGATIALGSAGWQAIADPEFAQVGADHTSVEYVEAGPAWGQTLAQGQADAALSWEGLRAQWRGQGLDFDYILGRDFSRFPANSFVIRESDFEDEGLHELYTQYLRGWAMGLEFGYRNPRAATQITMEEFPALNEQMTPDIAVDSMWELAVVFRGDWPSREGWGWHDLEAWDLFLTTIREIDQISTDIPAEDVVFNDFVAGANDFDVDQVHADADGFELSEEYEAVAVPEGAGE